jgi:hypothetical protein
MKPWNEKRCWFGIGWALWLGAFTACQQAAEQKTQDVEGAGPRVPVLDSNTGYCQDTCARTCTSDNECETSVGDLCCDLGEAGRVCMAAKECPRQCAADSNCATSSGEACLRIDLSTQESVCTQPDHAVQFCKQDSECGDGLACCKNYEEGICLPPSRCPHACKASDECNTAIGDVCCTTMRVLEPHLAVDGLCINPSRLDCPRTCERSTDCATGDGEICCEGVCSTSCRTQCTQSSDCAGQLCCKNALVRLPPPTKAFYVTPEPVASSAAPAASSAAMCAAPICGEGGACACAPGCKLLAGCIGADRCLRQEDSGACAAQGCTWDSDSSSCRNTLCYEASTVGACGNLGDGCQWYVTDTCTADL